MSYWIDGFRHDAHPSREIRIWEHISSCYLEFTSMTDLTDEQRLTTYKIFQAISCGTELDDLGEEISSLPAGSKDRIFNLWKYPVPIYDIEDDDFPLGYEMDKEHMNALKNGDTESFPYDIPDDLVYNILGQEPVEDDI